MKTLDQALAEIDLTAYPEAFVTAMRFILPHEVEFHHGAHGDYDEIRTENVPGDPGGQTRYGIDKAAHPHTDIDRLSLAEALDIYHDEWRQHRLDQIPDKLAIAAFDVWVNGGYANQWLQHAANENGASIAEDGQLGPASIAAIHECDEDAVLASFLAQRQARFNRLAQKDSLAQFLNGWTQRNEDLAAMLA